MSDKLKPCPACGSKVTVEYVTGTCMYATCCEDTHCLYYIECGVESATIEWWNRQPRIAELEQQLEEMTALVTVCHGRMELQCDIRYTDGLRKEILKVKK